MTMFAARSPPSSRGAAPAEGPSTRLCLPALSRASGLSVGGGTGACCRSPPMHAHRRRVCWGPPTLVRWMQLPLRPQYCLGPLRRCREPGAHSPPPGVRLPPRQEVGPAHRAAPAGSSAESRAAWTGETLTGVGDMICMWRCRCFAVPLGRGGAHKHAQKHTAAISSVGQPLDLGNSSRSPDQLPVETPNTFKPLASQGAPPSPMCVNFAPSLPQSATEALWIPVRSSPAHGEDRLRCATAAFGVCHAGQHVRRRRADSPQTHPFLKTAILLLVRLNRKNVLGLRTPAQPKLRHASNCKLPHQGCQRRAGWARESRTRPGKHRAEPGTNPPQSRAEATAGSHGSPGSFSGSGGGMHPVAASSTLQVHAR